jgi:hypothetical protein
MSDTTIQLELRPVCSPPSQLQSLLEQEATDFVNRTCKIDCSQRSMKC